MGCSTFLSLFLIIASLVGHAGANQPASYQHCHFFLSPFYYFKVPGQDIADAYVQIAWDWFTNSTVFSINALDRPANHHHEWAVWVGKEAPSPPSSKEYQSHFIFGNQEELGEAVQKKMEAMVARHGCNSMIITTCDADDSYAPFFATDVVQMAEESYSQGLRGGLLGHSNIHSSDFVIRGSSSLVYGACDAPGMTCRPLSAANSVPFISQGLTYFLASPFPTKLPVQSLMSNHMKWHNLLMIELSVIGYDEKQISVRPFRRKNVVYWMTPLSGRFLYQELIKGRRPPNQERVQEEITQCLGFKIDPAMVKAIPLPISFRRVCSINGIKRRKLIERNWQGVTKMRLSSVKRLLPRKGAFGSLCPKFLEVVCRPGYIQNNSTYDQLCE